VLSAGGSGDGALGIRLRQTLALAAGLLGVAAWPAAARGQQALEPAEALRLATTLAWLSLAAFSAGVLVGWLAGRRGWAWGVLMAAALGGMLACSLPADWAMIRSWLPLLGCGVVLMLGLGGLGGWLGARAARAN
jgi:hypothetical protein